MERCFRALFGAADRECDCDGIERGWRVESFPEEEIGIVGVDKDRCGGIVADFEAGKNVVPDGEFPESDDDELRMGFVDFSDQVAITGSLP